uniref:Uncharacterized protein n=1 Tax=Rhizophora mucronata TaxID=61149 RepID=A0A2P2NMN8_RHIMU
MFRPWHYIYIYMRALRFRSSINHKSLLQVNNLQNRLLQW